MRAEFIYRCTLELSEIEVKALYKILGNQRVTDLEAAGLLDEEQEAYNDIYDGLAKELDK
jgi:predicted transcriptional regulator